MVQRFEYWVRNLLDDDVVGSSHARVGLEWARPLTTDCLWSEVVPLSLSPCTVYTHTHTHKKKVLHHPFIIIDKEKKSHTKMELSDFDEIWLTYSYWCFTKLMIVSRS